VRNERLNLKRSADRARGRGRPTARGADHAGREPGPGTMRTAQPTPPSPPPLPTLRPGAKDHFDNLINNSSLRGDPRIDLINSINPDALFADGFNDALMGYIQIFTKVLPVYDRAKCIRILMKDGMNRDEAEEYFDFNVTGAWMGEGTPAFFVRISAIGTPIL